jgi:hypothetical protein
MLATTFSAQQGKKSKTLDKRPETRGESLFRIGLIFVYFAHNKMTGVL